MFRDISTNDGRELPFEYLPAAAITPKNGMALYMNGSGNLAVAGGANAAEYICCREESAAVTAGTIIPVVRIADDIIWESETAGTLTVGTGYDIASGGLTVADTSTGAADFFVDSQEETVVRGHFDRARAAAASEN